jgi:hypothetical protein
MSRVLVEKVSNVQVRERDAEKGIGTAHSLTLSLSVALSICLSLLPLLLAESNFRH